MKVSLPVKVQAELDLSPHDLAGLLESYFFQNYVPEHFDDAGCDWYTTKDTREVVVADAKWVVTNNPEAVILLDAINTLKGYQLHPDEIKCELCGEMTARAVNEAETMICPTCAKAFDKADMEAERRAEQAEAQHFEESVVVE